MGKRIYKKRFFKRKGRWSSNLQYIPNSSIIFPASQESIYTLDLCSNPTQDSTRVSQQYTVKNVKFSFQVETTLEAGFTGIESLIGYIMFVPQGMTVTVDYPKYHPEYIMGMRFWGSPEYENVSIGGIRNPLSITSRLARRLQTGDKIMFILYGRNTGSSQQQVNINGVLRWNTKAN